jgi:hypothetical protein
MIRLIAGLVLIGTLLGLPAVVVAGDRLMDCSVPHQADRPWCP